MSYESISHNSWGTPTAETRGWVIAIADLLFGRMQLTTARVLHQQLLRLRQAYDPIVVDCPPMQSAVTAAAVTQADLGLVPVLPLLLPVLAFSELVPLLHQAQGMNPSLALRFVINQLAPPDRPRPRSARDPHRRRHPGAADEHP